MQNDWGETDVGRVTPTPPFPSKSPRDNESNTGTISSTRGFVNELYDDDPDTQDFDDLIFALKTGGHFTPSEHEDQELEDKRNPSPPLPTEHYGVRRIEIADTHL